jgi:small subunit ribosomal protein S24e
MKIEILFEKENPLLERKEVRFKVIHEKGSDKVPEIRKRIAAELTLAEDRFVIQNVRTQVGLSESHGLLKIYRTPERMKQVEHKYVLIKNGLMEPEKREKETQEKEKKGEGE